MNRCKRTARRWYFNSFPKPERELLTAQTPTTGEPEPEPPNDPVPTIVIYLLFSIVLAVILGAGADKFAAWFFK